MESGEELLLDAKEVTKRGLELGYENRSSITDNGVREAMILDYHINDNFRQSLSINSDFDWLIMYHLG